MNHIERTLSDLRWLDDLGRQGSPLGRVDARAKLVCASAVLVTVASFGRYELSRPLPLLVLLAAAASAGDVPISLLVRRLSLASPFALLVAILNPLWMSEPMLRLGPFVLSAGWVSFLSVVERFVLAVLTVLILVATTGADRVAAALGRIGLPRVLVTQLVLLYRYGFVLAAEASRLLRAHALRAPDRPRPDASTVRSLLGQLLVRSVERAERIHTAMLCRGFAGSLPLDHTASFGIKECLVVAGTLGFCSLVRWIDVPGWLARLVT